MKLVFFGTPASAATSLAALHDAGHEILRAVTQPDRPRGRSRRPEPPPVKTLAESRSIPVHQPERVRTRAFRESVEALRPEVLVVVAYGRILSKRLLDANPRGAINLHFSLLPAYRGAAPVQWAIARGETETGVTTMQMNERLDAGAILLQEPEPIPPTMRTPELMGRLAERGARLLVRTLEGLERGTVTPREQDESKATFAPILSRADGAASPTLRAEAIAARVRGFDPWPGVWMRCGDRSVRLHDVRVAADGRSEPAGTLVDDDGAVSLVCGEGTALRLERVQFEGRRALSATEARNGRLLVPGERLDAPADA